LASAAVQFQGRQEARQADTPQEHARFVS
jgi:hypothetical protein